MVRKSSTENLSNTQIKLASANAIQPTLTEWLCYVVYTVTFHPHRTHAASTAQDGLIWSEWELHCRRSGFLLVCLPLAASTPWQILGKRNNSPKAGKVVIFFFSRFLYSLFPRSLTWNSGVTHRISEMIFGRKVWEVIQVQGAAWGRTIINTRQSQWFC